MRSAALSLCVVFAVQEIVAASAADDFAGVERAARRIGFSESMAPMCTHLGVGAPPFTERALEFHHTADGITAGARQNDPDASSNNAGPYGPPFVGRRDLSRP